MKKASILIAAFILLTAFGTEDIIRTDRQEEVTAVIVKNDKQALLDYYKKTSKSLLKNVKGLSDEQLQFRAAPDKWSVAQCVEHIVLKEEFLLNKVEKLMQEPANPERREEIKATDEDLINGMTDRSKKAQASEELDPSGKYANAKDAIKAFEEQRAKPLEYLKKAKAEDMRNHITDSPFGAVDAYQFALFIAGHTARHTLQIEEVKADAGFPSE